MLYISIIKILFCFNLPHLHFGLVLASNPQENISILWFHWFFPFKWFQYFPYMWWNLFLFLYNRDMCLKLKFKHNYFVKKLQNFFHHLTLLFGISFRNVTKCSHSPWLHFSKQILNTLYYNNYEHYNNGQLFAFQHLEIRSSYITKIMPTIHNHTFLKLF